MMTWVKEVKELTTTDAVNELLANGWKLLFVGERTTRKGTSTMFICGRAY